MSILPNWSVVAAALVVGLGVGVVADHKVMQSRADKVAAAHSEELRVREVQRAKDEVAAREEERRLIEQAGKIEQEKTDEIAKIRTAAAADLARLQNRPDRKAAPAGGVPTASTACSGSTGAELSRADAGFLVGEAARADELRAGLTACYQAYDSLK